MQVKILGTPVKYTKNPVEKSWEEAVRYFGLKAGLTKYEPEYMYRTISDFCETAVINRAATSGSLKSTYERWFRKKNRLATLGYIKKFIDNPAKTWDCVSFEDDRYINDLFFRDGKLNDIDTDNYGRIVPQNKIISRSIPWLRGKDADKQIEIINSALEEGKLNYTELFKLFLDKLRTGPPA